MKLTEAMIVGARGRHRHLDISPEEFRAVTTEDIIDGFLSVGEYRINPDDNVAEEDISAINPIANEEIISQELAQIYARQGLTQQAEEMYSKLQQMEQAQRE